MIYVMSRILPIFLLMLSACTAEVPSEELLEHPTDWLIRTAPNFLEDRAFRRAELEASLWMPEIPYAKKRLEAYGLDDRGWDHLPEMKFTTERVGANPKNITFETEVPTSREDWLALGKKVFWDMPMRRDGYLEWLAARPEHWERSGLQTDEDGNIRGIVKFQDVTGRTRMGVTCGICHGDQGVDGATNDSLDLGYARYVFGQEVGANFEDGKDWGPGRVDVTDDGVSDPISIPNLWALSQQSHINKSGAIRLDSPAALAIRFETQYIEGHAMMARPNRVHVLALAMYVYALQSGTEHAEALTAEATAGKQVFETTCAECHIPQTGYGGGLVAASMIDSNPMATQSPMRGTSFFKIPTLVGISNQGRFMADGKIDSLEGVLDSGHPYGESLGEDDRNHLLEFLNTL